MTILFNTIIIIYDFIIRPLIW